MKLLIINGPNMNLLSIREPSVYGNRTYDELVQYIIEKRGEGNEMDFVQSNYEGKIIDEIHRAYFNGYDGIVINPAGYSHTSVAIMDAVAGVPTPVVEVHLSDPSQRETFRKTDYVALASDATVAGKGFDGYVEAIDILAEVVGK